MRLIASGYNRMLYYLFILFSAAGTAFSCILGGMSPWWILPVFIGSFIGWNLLYALFFTVLSFCLSNKKPVERPNSFCCFIIWLTMGWLNAAALVKIRTTGTEILPDCPCVFVGNHISDFDPMVVLATLGRRKLIYISKESNFKIPVAGRFIYRAGFLAIDRENPLRAMRTLKRAAEFMKEYGVDVGIYPEGTRSKTGELLEFKPGAFLLAKRADAPIVVLRTTGTEQVSKKFLRRRTNVKVEILDVVSRETVRNRSIEELAVLTRDIIANQHTD